HLSMLRASPTGIDHHSRLPERVGFVVSVVIEDFELRSIELLRPVTLFASVLRGTKVVNRCRDWTRILVEHNGVDLIRARHLRAKVPLRAGTDVAVHASHPRVWRSHVRRELGVHRGVT